MFPLYTVATHVVLNRLDLCVQQGEIFALLGVNGAGKTTSLECMECLRKYDGGSILINGIMGIQLQSASLPEHLKPLEAVKLFAKWNKTPLDKETYEHYFIYCCAAGLSCKNTGKSEYVFHQPCYFYCSIT